MTYLNVFAHPDPGILLIYADREEIETNPDYQRMGGIWNLEKQQLLIDSILNGFDIPKLYFHKFTREKFKKKMDQGYTFAIIDGKQRLEAIWDFIDGKYSLADDFEYYSDPNIKAGGLGYLDLAVEYPKLKLKFDQKALPIVCVETDDIEIIEEMFSRLNEAVTLNAAEKRNALGGPMAKAIVQVSNTQFFKEEVPFNNKRYQHREVAAKFLLLEYSDKILDTKKAFLDKMVKDFKKRQPADVSVFVKNVSVVLSSMSKVFVKKDKLLRTQGMVVVYFLIFRNFDFNSVDKKITRKAFLDFETLREENRKSAEKDITYAKYELIQFDRFSLQGTNDGASIKFRYQVLEKYLSAYLTGSNLDVFD